MHLSFSTANSRSWSSISLFTVKSFSLALSSSSNLTLFQPATFLWEAKAPLKFKAFAWLVAHRKVNTNDSLQVRRPFKSLNPQWCILCKGEGEAIDHLFLHCPYLIGLWNKLCNSTGLVWVSPRRIEDIFTIAFKGFGSCTRGKTLWQIACL